LLLCVESLSATNPLSFLSRGEEQALTECVLLLLLSSAATLPTTKQPKAWLSCLLLDRLPGQAHESVAVA
jgi:hypothetical protein